MSTRATARWMLPATLALALGAGCGTSIEGTYTGDSKGAFFDSLTFKNGGKVEITFQGSTAEGTYVVDGDAVKITNGGQTQVFGLGKDGCIDGGGMIGKYCRK